MNSRQIEEAFEKEVEFISKKVTLGELSQDEGDFLIKQARARTDRELSRLKRPGRLLYYVLTLCLGLSFVVCFWLSMKKTGVTFYWPLWGLLACTLGFLAVLQIEIRRLEFTFSQFFSKAWFHKVLHAPRIDFEWQKQSVVQIHLHIKNEHNLYAGLRDEEICELRSRILDCVHEVFDNGEGIVEFVGEDSYVIDFLAKDGADSVHRALKSVDTLFSTLRSRDGEWYSKSVRMAAGVVSGIFWVGTMGHGHRVFRVLGRRRTVAGALANAAGWEEIYLDEDTAADAEKWIYVHGSEPIFLRDSKELIKVCRLSGWKDSQP